MTATQSLNLYNISLKYFKNEADASSFVKEIEVVVDNKFDTQKGLLATKEDITLVRLEAREQKSDLIKWMFVFWASSVITTIGGLVAIVHFMMLK